MEIEEKALPQEETPQYELTSPEVAYPVSVHGRTVYVHMKPYIPTELKELQYARALRMATADDFTDIKDRGKAEVVQFFWQHFIKLSGPAVRRADGSEGTPDEHKKWLQDHPRLGIESAVILQGFGSVNLEPVDDSESGSILDSMSMASESNIPFSKKLYDPKTKGTVIYKITPVFKQESEADSRRYQQATGNLRIYRQQRESQILINYDVIEQLFNSLIKEVRGVTFEGKPCVRHDIDPWITAFPFWWKDIALAELFKGATVKNE